MRFVKLTIENLNSLRERQTVEFAEPPLSQVGLFAITGDTGAGKTTLLDGITLALYGQIPRHKDPKESLSWGAVEALAEVEFEHDGHLYRSKWTVWRSRRKLEGMLQQPKRELSRLNPKTGAFDILAEKVKEVDEAVESITGLDYHRFRRSVLLAQGDFAAFLESDERERSELLERITGTEVYSDISKAAFAKSKLERENLLAIEAQMEGDLPMPEDQRQRLVEELTIRQKQVGDLQQEWQKWQKLYGRYQRLQEIDDQQHRRRKELELWVTRKNDMESDRQKLARARQIVPYEAQILEWRTTSQKKIERQQNLEDLQQNLIRAQAHRAALVPQVEQWTNQLASEKKAFRQQSPIWEKAEKLDLTFQERSSQLKGMQKRLDDLIQTHEQTSSDLQKQENRLAQSATQKENLEKWLAQNPGTDRIEVALSEINAAKQLLTEGQRDREKGEKTLAGVQLDLDEASKNVEQTEHSLQVLAQKREALQKQLEKVGGDTFAADKRGWLRQLDQEVQKLKSEQGYLEQLAIYSARYQRINRNLALVDQELEQLDSEAFQLSRMVFHLLQQKNEAIEDQAYREKIHLQQQHLLSFQEARQNLKPGEPCPVCGATEHPFDVASWEPQVDKSAQDLERAKKRVRDLEGQLQEASHHESKQYTETEKIREQKQGLQKQLLELEEAMSPLKEHLDALVFAERPEQIEKRVAQLNVAQQVKTDQKQKLEALIDQWSAIEREEHQLQKDQQTHLGQVERLLERQDNGHTFLAEATQKILKAKTILEQGFGNFKLSWKLSNTEECLQQLVALRNEGQKKSSLLRQADQTAQAAGEQIERLQELFDKQKQHIAQQQAALEKATTDWNQVLQERLALLPPSLMPAQVRQEAQDKIEATEHQLEQVRSQLERANLSCEGLEAKSTAWEQQLVELKKRHDLLVEELTGVTKSCGYPNLEAMDADRMRHDEMNRMTELFEEQDREINQLERLLQESEKECMLLQKELDGQPDASEAKVQMGASQKAYEEAQREVGRREERLTADDEKRAKVQRLRSEWDKQEKECRRWDKLNELIGSADGKKFRTFAQGLTLEKLIGLANRHLLRLNGRYRIQKAPLEDLELDIIDQFQADNRRSMRTLSGGERFLVSLALALGLSDLAGRQVQISSLFIDEGFGTLDDNSLDLAITTLENLQSTGKTIGIISHVHALKERIGVRLHVVKSSDGFSRVELIQ